MTTPISPAQLRAIHAMARKADLSEDDLHALAQRMAGVESLKALSMSQAGQIINHFKRLLGQPIGQASPARATLGQQGKVMALARSMGWMDDPKRLRGFLEKRLHVSDVKFLSPAQAGLCIEALKAIQEGGRAERRRANDP